MVYKSSTLAAGGSSSGTGGGIVSINSDTTPAQVIAAGSGISVNTSAGTTTITNTSAGSVSSVFVRTGAVVAQWNDYQFNLTGGTASVSQGGTGVQTLSAHGVLLGEGIANISAATTGIAGRLLIDQGGVDPNFQVLTGDASLASTGAITFSTVNSNVGTFGSSSLVPAVTANGKGLITAISASTITAPASLITGSTLASNVIASSLTTIGALASGSLVSGFTIVSPSLGGTGQNNSSATGVAQWSNGISSVSTGLFNGTTAITQAASDNSTKVATDAFVTTAINNAIAGINPAIAVQATTTQASDTSGFSYLNGVSGIGATLTGPNNVDFTVDGFTFTTLGQRVLVKNDTQSPSGAFNGIYYVTTLKGALQGVVLTRALDYDQPSDINNTGAIPVINGTINAQTTWVETATVNTIGVDPLSFTKFSINPTTILTNTLTNSHIFVGNGSNVATDVAMAGDASINSAGSITVLKVNAVSYPAAPATNTVPVVTSSNTITYEAVPNAALLNSAITIGAQTGLAGGGTVALGAAITMSMGTNTANTLAGYNSSGIFSDVSIGTNLNLVGGVLGTSNISAGTSISISYSTNTLGITYTGSATGVSTITNTDGSLTITPQTGVVQASLNVGHANTWTATQTSSVSGGVTSFITTGTQEFSIFAIGNSGSGTPTIKWENGNTQSVTISAACTLGFTLPTHPSKLTVLSRQSATTGFPYAFAGTVIWPGGTKPTFSAISNARDASSFIYDGTVVWGVANTGFA